MHAAGKNEYPAAVTIMCIAKFATGNILLCYTLTVYCNFTLTFLKYTEHYSLRKPMQSVFCLNWLPYQPPLVLLPLATHRTWSEASTPLKRSKLGKVDEALSVFVCVCVCLLYSRVYTWHASPPALHFRKKKSLQELLMEGNTVLGIIWDAIDSGKFEHSV